MMTKEQRNNVQFRKGQLVQAHNRLNAAADWFKQNGEMVGDDHYVRGADVAVYLYDAAQKLQDAINAIGWLTGIKKGK